MRCPNCNTELPDGSEFCFNCGQQIVLETAEPAPAADPKEELKAAKAAYKEARKRAGKSNLPKVIAGLLALTLVGGGAAYGTWYWMNGQTISTSEADAKIAEATDKAKTAEDELKKANEKIEELEKQVKTYEDEAKKAEEEAKKAEEAIAGASDAEPAEDADDYIGLWTGKLSKASGSTYACYAAQDNPIQLVIKSLDATGRVKVDVRVLYHGHNVFDLGSDVDNADGDRVLEFTDLTSTLSNGSFRLNLDVTDIAPDASLVVDVRTDDQYSSGRQLSVEVTSILDRGRGSSVDTFSLTRASKSTELPAADAA